MGTEQKTLFKIDKSKCQKCGRCINTCAGMVLEWGKDGFPEIKPFERFGWRAAGGVSTVWPYARRARSLSSEKTPGIPSLPRRQRWADIWSG